MNNINTDFYKVYINSKNKKRIDKNAEYYWIAYENGIRWSYTKWTGFADENFPYEIRKIREIPPLYAIDLCEKVYGKQMMIINEVDEVEVFRIVGGHVIVKKGYVKNIYRSLLSQKLLKLTNNIVKFIIYLLT